MKLLVVAVAMACCMAICASRVPLLVQPVAITGRYKDLAGPQNETTVDATFDFQGVAINASFANFSNISIWLSFACSDGEGQHRETFLLRRRAGDRKSSSSMPNRFAVYVNGSLKSYLDSGAAPCNTRLSFPLVVSDVVHHAPTEICVFKITEPDFNVGNANIPNYVTFHGFGVSSGVGSNSLFRLESRQVQVARRRLQQKSIASRRIEFVGDSITCGYCNLCKQMPPNSSNTYEKESFALSWPTLTCRRFGASCHTEAWSGRGMIRNCDAAATTLMPEIFDRTRATVPADQAAGDRWTFTDFVPDVVVVNLGTNDFGCNRIDNVTAFSDKFQRAYIEVVYKMLIEYARTEVKIFLACGPMSEAYCPDVFDIIKFVESHGFPNQVFFLDHRSNTCCGHPSSEADEVMAERALKTIANVTGW